MSDLSCLGGYWRSIEALNPSHSPSPRYGHDCVYDEVMICSVVHTYEKVGDVLYVIGGSDEKNGSNGNLWRFNYGLSGVSSLPLTQENRTWSVIHTSLGKSWRRYHTAITSDVRHLFN